PNHPRSSCSTSVWMTVCFDTNVLMQLFGRDAPFRPILEALLPGELALAVSNEVLTEYEEVVTRILSPIQWQRFTTIFDLMNSLYGNVIRVEPHFRFQIVTADPDDNKFCDCAISANAEFLITEDRHFK